MHYNSRTPVILYSGPSSSGSVMFKCWADGSAVGPALKHHWTTIAQPGQLEVEDTAQLPTVCPVSRIHSTNVVLMLGQR